MSRSLRTAWGTAGQLGSQQVQFGGTKFDMKIKSFYFAVAQFSPRFFSAGPRLK